MRRIRAGSTIAAMIFLLALEGSVLGSDDDCRMTEPQVFTIDPGPELAELGASLAGTRDPAVAFERPGIAVVLFPLPCGERALRVHVTVWNGFVVSRRRQTLRTLMSVAGVVRPEPPAWMAALGAAGWPRESRFRLKRRTRLSAAQSHISTINGYGVATFPVVCSHMTAATFVVETERLKIGRGGKIKRRQVRRQFAGVRIGGGDGSAAQLDRIHRLLDWSERPPGPAVPWP